MRGVLIVCITTIAIILLGTTTLHYLDRTATDLATLLLATQEAIVEDNWPLAEERLNASLARWEELQPPWSALINHKEIDEIQMTLERAKEYILSRDKKSAVAEVAVAKLLVEHVPEKERLSWSNIF
jgi:hypothetical protein